MLVICAGMLRAGSTLQYNLVCSLLEKAGAGKRQGRIDTEQEWFAHPFLVTWAQDRSRYHVVKRGLVHFPELQMFGDGVVRICYIYRDIRDVAASAKEMWGLSGDRLQGFLDQVVSVYETLRQMPSVLYQRYEDVIHDTTGAVLEIARFLEVTPSQQIVQEVVEQCSLVAMTPMSHSRARILIRSIRRTLGWVKQVLPGRLKESWGLRQFVLRLLPAVERRTLIAPRHISSTRGAIGSWRHKLEKEEQETITARYKNWLIQAGYSVEGPPL